MADRSSLTGSWLAARWGLDPVAIEMRRRAGELVATRDPGSDEWSYPAWQFDIEGNVKPEVARVLQAARDRGVRPDQLGSLLNRRVGLAGGRTMVDAMLAGDERSVVAALRSN
jgi:hypothetical protein